MKKIIKFSCIVRKINLPWKIIPYYHYPTRTDNNFVDYKINPLKAKHLLFLLILIIMIYPINVTTLTHASY